MLGKWVVGEAGVAQIGGIKALPEGAGETAPFERIGLLSALPSPSPLAGGRG